MLYVCDLANFKRAIFYFSIDKGQSYLSSICQAASFQIFCIIFFSKLVFSNMKKSLEIKLKFLTRRQGIFRLQGPIFTLGLREILSYLKFCNFSLKEPCLQIQIAICRKFKFLENHLSIFSKKLKITLCYPACCYQYFIK